MQFEPIRTPFEFYNLRFFDDYRFIHILQKLNFEAMNYDNLTVPSQQRPSFRALEERCEQLFYQNAPFWHLCTPGDQVEIVYTDDEEFKYGVTLLAVCLLCFPTLNVYTFELMNNHIHIILSGSEDEGRQMFDMYKKKLKHYLFGRGRPVDLGGFEPELIPIPDLNALRNEIAYVNRNGYVVHPECTPYSYRWGANMYFFNPSLAQLGMKPYSSLPYKEKRLLTNSRVVDFPNSYQVWDGMISPLSFCSIQSAEALFRNAHQYFNILCRNVEVNSQISKRLRDTVFLTDDELYSAVCSICKKKFGCTRPVELKAESKMELAKSMHFDYNASNRQIRNILKLDDRTVSELFPSG